MKKFGRVAKTLKRAALAAIVLGPTGLIFSTTQTWVDRQKPLSPEFVFWVIPLLASATYFFLATGVATVVAGLRRPDAEEPATLVAHAFLEYAKKLSGENRDESVLKLRAAASHILHTQGLNDVRRSLGRIALDSAVRTRDEAARVSILIDDLGWTEHLLGEDRRATASIAHGVALAAAAHAQQGTDEYARLQVKGMRHLALIEAPRNITGALGNLDAAARIVAERISNARTRAIETAQLLHAKALAVAIDQDVHKSGRLRADEANGAVTITQAYEWAHQARVAFEQAESPTRYTKALFLEQRLLEALGRDVEAKAVSVLLLQGLTKTTWEVDAQQKNIRGA